MEFHKNKLIPLQSRTYSLFSNAILLLSLMSLEDWVWIRNFLLALLFPFANKGFRGCVVVANGNEFDMEKKWNKIRIFMSDGSNTSLESLNIHLDKVIYTKSQMILEGKRQSCVWQARKTQRITSYWYL